MKTETMVIVAAAAALVAFKVYGTKAALPIADESGQTAPWERGGAGFVAAHGQQTQMTDAAIQKNWQDTFAALDKSQPDWWI